MTRAKWYRHHARAARIAILFSIFFTHPCQAAGAWLTEAGGTDMGMAGAGRAAMSQDAAALAANPAAIGGLPRTTMTVALMPLALDLEFRGHADPADSVTNDSSVIPAGSLFGVYRAERLSLGAGLYSYMGLGFDLGNEWAGRRLIERADLTTFNVAPSVAWRLTDRLHLGASLAAQYASTRAELAVGNDGSFYGPPFGLPEGQIELSGNSWAGVAHLGLLFQATPDTSFGIAWTSGAEHSIDQHVDPRHVHPVLVALIPPRVELELTLPQQLTLSASTAFSPTTTLAVSTGWQDWSVMGGSSLSTRASAPLFPDGLHDTWHASVGIRRQLRAPWTLTAGIAYDSDPSVNDDMPAYFPTAEQTRLAGGIEYKLSENHTLRAAFSVVDQGKVRVERGAYPIPLPGTEPVQGSFSPGRIYVLAVAADLGS